jgi:hypothetical protein
MSIGYRRADGMVAGRSDDAYHYRGTFEQPLGDNNAIRAEGQLYDRDGPLHLQPDFLGKKFNRERIERSAELSLINYNNTRTRRRELTYTYLLQASRITSGYFGNLNHLGHGLALAQEWSSGDYLLRAEGEAAQLQYDDSYVKRDRISAGAFLNIAKYSSEVRMIARAGSKWVEHYRFLPAAGVVISRESEKSLLLTSVGYAERAPSLHELHLRPKLLSVYGTGSFDYLDQGNPLLTPEKQLTANVRVELGSADNAWALSLTGGKIFDGIDWQLNDSNALRIFSPANADINFLDVTFTKKIRIADLLRFKGGGSYHYLDYAAVVNKAYSPEYQTFGGMELHVYWPQRLIHLFAYGEVVYVGPYSGYDDPYLGQAAVFNAKLSFRSRSFRFHWIIQNVLQQEYASRDYFVFPGQYHSWGFTWDFLN